MTRSATGSTCGATSARSSRSKSEQRPASTRRIRTAPGWPSLLDPLIKNGTVPPLSVFTPDFAKKYGGDDDKVLMMPGPTWYAQAVFNDTLHIPAGQMTAAMPLQWENETPVTTGQVGGGPWIISRHSKNIKAAADFVTWVTTVFNPTGKDKGPATRPTRLLADSWLATLGHEPLLRRRPDAGAQGGRPPDLAGLEPGHVSRPARLVQHRRHATGRRQVAELAAATARRRAGPGGPGGWL